MKQENQPYVYRRHTQKCAQFGRRNASVEKCRCPFHADGIYRGQRLRQSLSTRNHRSALEKLATVLDRIDAASDVKRETISLSDACERFLQHYGEVSTDGQFRGDIKHSTWRKYRTKVDLLREFCSRQEITRLEGVTFEVLEAYRRSRRATAAITWRVELQALRTFFAFCVSRKWITANPARELKSARGIPPNTVVPYTFLEESKILAACDAIGRTTYERRRARAMIMLLRHTALRISDVSMLRRDAVDWDLYSESWRIRVRTLKSGEPVFLPIPAELKLALDALPEPRNSLQESLHYFWNGVTSQRSVIGIAQRTLSAVFKKSGVAKAHAHRFRHTLATRLLERGATYEQVADVLGNTPEVVRKHYAKWSKGRQDGIDRLMKTHFQTGQMQAQSHIGHTGNSGAAS